MRDLENGRFCVLVDRDNTPRGLHSNKMLDRAGDPNGDIKFRRYSLTGTADLILARQPLRIHNRTRRADSAADRLRQIENQLKILFLLQSAATRNDHRGG